MMAASHGMTLWPGMNVGAMDGDAPGAGEGPDCARVPLHKNSDRKVCTPTQLGNLSGVRAMESFVSELENKRRHPGVPALQGPDEGGGMDRPGPKRPWTDRL